MLKWILIFTLLLSVSQAQPQTQLTSGQNGWLFQQDEYSFKHNNKADTTQKALQHIVVIDKLLEAKGITLMLSLTPSKIGLYETQLPETQSLSSSFKERYSRALDYLRSEGVLVADVKTAFVNSDDLLADFPLFQRLDHRWSSKGALLAAEVVAKTLRTDAASLLDGIHTVEYSLNEIGESNYTNSSLYSLADPELQARLLEQSYYPELFKQFAFERITEASEGLLNEAEIVLLGNSFSQGELNSEWPFHSALQYYLSKELMNVSQAATDPWEAMSTYLNNAAFSETPPKLIIWEFWEPFLEAFGQAQLKPDWLINNSSQLVGGCVAPLNSVTKVRSNGRLYFNDGLRLVNSNAETFIEFRLENQLELNHYLSFEGQFESPENSSLGIEIGSLDWQRSLTLPVQANYQQQFNIPLYLEAGKAVQTVKLYPEPNSNVQLSKVQICSLPEYVLAALDQPLDASKANLGVEAPSSIFTSGLGDIEESYGRWGLGPSSELTFYLNENKTLDLALAFINPIEKQKLELRFNGELLKNYTDLAEDVFIQETVTLAGKKGMNKLELKYALWNGLADSNSSETAMPFAVFFETLGLFEVGQVVFTPSDNIAAVASGLSKVRAFPIQDIARLSEAENIALQGFSGVEDGLRRWALGPQSSLTIQTPEATVIQVDMSFFNPIAGQTVSVSFNDQTIETISDIALQSSVDRSYTLETQAGDNVLRLSYADWNLNNAVISEQDTRPMAILFNQLSLKDLAPEARAAEASPLLAVTADAAVAFVKFIETSEVSITGLAEADDSQFRWSLGPETQLKFSTDTSESLRLDMAFFNPIDGQSITIRFNDRVVQELPQVYPNSEMNLTFFLSSSPGLNQLSISYSHINGEHVTFAPNDQRPLALLYKSLNLSLEP